MDEQIAKKLLDYVQSTRNFVLELLPDVIQQAIKSEKASAYMGVALSFVLAAIAVYVGLYFYRAKNKKNNIR